MFAITKDHVAQDGDRNREGMAFNNMPQYGMERAAGLDDTLPRGFTCLPFQLWDEDGELHYEGVLSDDPDATNQLAALRFGESDTGATIIKVLRDGEWKVEIG